jgi:antirestriction protein ArdC
VPNVYEIVTDQIITQLQNGVAPWRRPWQTAEPCNLISQKPYRGINTFLLAGCGMPSRYWLTYNQATKLGGNVKRGEHSSLVVFWSVGKEKLNPKTGKISKPFLLRYYRVFNLSQTEGIAHKLGLAEASAKPIADIDACERIVSDMPNPPHIVTNGEAMGKAWYRPSSDTVGIPSKSAFHDSEGFYSTLFHELTHSTGHASRIGREGIEHVNAFGSDSYSREELIAEMGAAMLCGVTGIAPVTLENSAAYLKSWITALRGDSKLLVTAASAAQKAADYIRGLSVDVPAPNETK